MTSDEQRKLENQLIVMGLNKLEDPELIPQMARLILGHEDYMGMINACDVQKRREMYDALRPHLRFEPHPLEWYECKLAEKAGNVDSYFKSVAVGKETYEIVPPGLATGLLLTFTCSKCTRTAQFQGPDMVQTVLKARRKGWARDVAEGKEICPKCPAVRPLAKGRAAMYV